MTFIERFESARKLWAITLPGVALPPDQTICSWLNVYGDKEFETAAIHIPRRIQNWTIRYGRIDPVHVYKLMSIYLKIAKQTKGSDPIATRFGSTPPAQRGIAPQSKQKEVGWNAAA